MVVQGVLLLEVELVSVELLPGFVESGGFAVDPVKALLTHQSERGLDLKLARGCVVGWKFHQPQIDVVQGVKTVQPRELISTLETALAVKESKFWHVVCPLVGGGGG